MRVYQGSDGRYYTEWDIWERFESDEWRPCMWDPAAGWELVETEGKSLLRLHPVPMEALPAGVELDTEDRQPTVLDSRACSCNRQAHPRLQSD